MASTTNFNWTTPDNTGYVKDGALAIRTLGQSIDTSMAKLKSGTTGQFLKKTSSTDMDFEWASPGMVLLSTTTLSGAATTVSSISGSYRNLLVVIKNIQQSINFDGAYLTINSDTGTNYHYGAWVNNNNTITGYSDNNDTKIPNVFWTSTTTTDPDKLGTATFNFYRYTDTDVIQGDWRFTGAKNDSVVSAVTGQFSYNCSAAITSLTFTTYTGTFSGGTIYVYGVN